MKFSEYFGLNKTQAELDFVDIDISQDLPLFIDPFVMSNQANDWAERCNCCIASFFQTVLDCIRMGKDEEASRLLMKLGEPNETCFGFSSGEPSGRGIGKQQASDLLRNMKKSRAVKTGLISDIAEMDLFVENVGPDKISDMTTNILRGLLIEYTQEQCKLHSIKLNNKYPSGWVWDTQNCKWKNGYVEIPCINGKKVLLVPKIMVRWSMTLNNEDYYNNFVLSFIRDEQLDLNGQLVEVLKSGKRIVTKKSMKEAFPKSKNFLSVFSENHPKIFENYKKIKGEESKQPIPTAELVAKIMNGDMDFDEKVFAGTLKDFLHTIEPGKEKAHDYHSFIIGVLQFIFDGNLIYPVKEQEINSGRKRIDICYTNAAESGFFYRAAIGKQTCATQIMVECKNYSTDPKNPEIDQIRGRFSPRRGFLGFLLCRKIDDKKQMLARCRDVALDGAGYIIALDDHDIECLLDYIVEGRRSSIDAFLTEKLKELEV